MAAAAGVVELDTDRSIEFISKEAHPDFLDEWELIPQGGQNNCGVFISKRQQDRIMKCENSVVTSDYSKFGFMLDIRKKLPFTKLYPQVYQVYNNKYIVMDKLDGDLTKL